MEHGGTPRPLFRAQAGAGTSDRRRSERTRLRRPGRYQFNVSLGETLQIYEGTAQIRDMSSGGMCLELDRQPEEHGIVEVCTAERESPAWVWLLGICWIREAPNTERSKWVAGGRFLFGRCLN